MNTVILKRLYDKLVITESSKDDSIDSRKIFTFSNVADNTSVKLERIHVGAASEAVESVSVYDGKIDVPDTSLTDGTYRITAENSSCLFKVLGNNVIPCFDSHEYLYIWRTLAKLADELGVTTAKVVQYIDGYATE